MGTYDCFDDDDDDLAHKTKKNNSTTDEKEVSECTRSNSYYFEAIGTNLNRTL